LDQFILHVHLSAHTIHHRVTTEQRVTDVAQKTGEEGVKVWRWERRGGECFWKHWHTGA